jgi:hypothetical protein
VKMDHRHLGDGEAVKPKKTEFYFRDLQHSE